jgi:signal peptidase I
MTDPVMQESSSQEKISSSSTHPESRGSLILYTIVAIGLALFIRYFVAAPYIVQGASMEPSFHDFHYLIIEKVSYRFSEPERGDVIVLDLPYNTSRALIKRVIGLPGETVRIENGVVSIVNTENPAGFILAEPYLAAENRGGPDNLTLALGADQYFVLGDNRRVSSDSRSWGTLPREDIVGHVLMRLFPFTAAGFLPGKTEYEEK